MWRVAPVPVTVSYQVEGTLGPSPLGTGDTSTLILRRAGQGGYDRNSNLLTAVDSVMGQWNYTYDNLNRLTTAQASALPAGLTLPGSYGCWSFDPFGNRTAEAWQNTACPTPASSLAPTATYNSGNQLSWTSVNAAGSNVTYDPAGNMTYDGRNSYLYDAEGRVAVQEVVNGTNFLTGYIYDAGGTRVAKGSLQSLSCNFSSNGFTTNTSWVLGPGGEQVTEYAVSGGASTWTHTNVFAGGKLLATYNGSDTSFALEDWLGSKRVEIDATGHCAATFASLPFGNTPSNGNSYQLGTLPGYQLCGDATEHHFTGKERDTESGNDYFNARYYSSAMGRFMSPDPAGVRAIKLANPQTWNWYAYTLNNPLRYTDPTGKYTCADDGNKCQSQNDKNFEAARQRDLGSKDKGVAAAAAAYGDPTKDNHVGVQFTDNKDSRTDLSVSFNGKSVTSQITSTISTSGNLDNTVGHEGTHVEQEQALGASFKPDGSFNGKLNLTIYGAKNGAFHTEATIMQLSGKPQQLGNDFRFPINPTDSPAQVDRMINQYLALPEDQGGNYGVTPQNPGGTLVQPK